MAQRVGINDLVSTTMTERVAGAAMATGDTSDLRKAIEKLIAENRSMKTKMAELETRLNRTDARVEQVSVRADVAYHSVRAEDDLHEHQYENRYMDPTEDDDIEQDRLQAMIEARRREYEAKAPAQPPKP